MKDSKVFTNPIILKILDYYKNLWALGYTSAIAHWDLETYMPKKGSMARGQALGRLATIRQKMFLENGFISLINKADEEKTLSDEEKGVVRILKRSLDFYEKIPSTFLEKFENLTSNATVVWRDAKEKDNYEIFEPALSKIFEMNKQMAEYIGYIDSPYDALLDLFEEGLTSKQVSNFFDEIRDPLKTLLNRITTSKKYSKDHWLEDNKYDKDAMHKLNDKVLGSLWSDSDRFRIDISTHPFTTSFSNNDTRITTWYHKKNFARSLLATVHEFGHALYELQSADEFEMTPLAGGSSLVIHESQSRFWENFVGRSDNFIKKFLPDMEKVVSGAWPTSSVDKKLTVDDVSLYFNKVTPGLLRVEADEVTYHFHIMLRYEIEKGLMEDIYHVSDVKEVWNTKMKEYLGIMPKKDSEGVLQDIHWSGGSVGYFPTYSLGTFLGAQWEKKITGDPKKWLEKNVHQFGSTYTLSELLKKNKMSFDPSVNLKYLEDKYSKIYDFTC